MAHALADALPASTLDAGPADDASASLPSWAEEALAPEQVFSPAADAARHWTGERRLLLAVLRHAVEEFLRHRHARTTRGKRLFRETRDWFWSREQNRLCAFETICAYLQLDADYIRRGLRRLLDTSASPPLLRSARRDRRTPSTRYPALLHGKGKRRLGRKGAVTK